MVKELSLEEPIYRKTSRFGYFGKNDPAYTWEKPKTLVGDGILNQLSENNLSPTNDIPNERDNDL